MLDVSTNDVAPVVGPTSEFIRNEILRVGAPAAEVRRALAFVASEASLDPRAYDALSPRMRRLVDLVAVAGISVSKTICELSAAPAA